MRIDQALDLGHSAITIQEDVRQSCGLSKLYSVRQPATCFVVKSSRKAKSVRQLLERSAALFLLLLPSYRSLERTAANWSILVSGTPPARLLPQSTALPAYHTLIDGPASLPSIANRRPYLPAIMPTFVSNERTIRIIRDATKLSNLVQIL
jgi:hypothetical protein